MHAVVIGIGFCLEASACKNGIVVGPRGLGNKDAELTLLKKKLTA